MAGTLPQPRVLKNTQSTQLSYELPHRIHSAKAYPVQSSNGSTVILYGHENGVQIVWRGGRAFKPQQETSGARQKTNGTGNAAIISLDSDDDGEPSKSSKAFEDKPEFEDQEEGLDPSRPYPKILQVLDLYFGTDVLHLAILPSTVLTADGPSWRGLESLKQKIVFAAACADNSIRYVTLPLTPPSPASKARSEFRTDFTLANAGQGSWGETVIVLGGHQKPSDGVSMTADFAGVKTESKSSTPVEPHIVIASHSREVAGLLLLYRVPIKSIQKHIEPFQSIYLGSPAKSVSFNPSLSTQISSHLLVADSIGACRIYDYKLLIKTTEENLETPPAEQGTWLLSLYAGFQNSKSDSQINQYSGAHAGFGRKEIVDAQWVSGGRAIVVLLNDGEWAVWDIEGVGPGASQGLLGRQGIKGGSRSEYSLTGYIDGAAKARPSGPPQITSSKFAPMTPATRKSADPFSGRGFSGPVRGQISVVETRSSLSTSPSEESVLFWLGDSYSIIPNLAKYWAAHSQKTGGSGNLFSGPTGNRAIKLENVDLQGERCSGIEQIAKTTSSTGLSSDVLILGEHRFAVLSYGKQALEQPSSNPGGRLALVEKKINGGELDVVGIEQALTRMENGATKRKVF